MTNRPTPKEPVPTPNPSPTKMLGDLRTIVRSLRGDPNTPSGITSTLAPLFGKRVKGSVPTPPNPPARQEFVPREGREWITRTQEQHTYTQAELDDRHLANNLNHTNRGNVHTDYRVNQQRQVLNTGSIKIPNVRGFWPIYILVLAIALWAGITIGTVLTRSLGDMFTTMKYGDPRTTHLIGNIGLNDETSGNPTVFEAVNYSGVAYIFVLPGTDINRTMTLVWNVPNDPEGKYPVNMEIFDCDRDGHKDLLVYTDSGAAVWLLDTGKQILRVPSPEETARLILPVEFSH